MSSSVGDVKWKCDREREMSLVVCLCCLVWGFSTFRTRLVMGPTHNFIMFADFSFELSFSFL